MPCDRTSLLPLEEPGRYEVCFAIGSGWRDDDIVRVRRARLGTARCRELQPVTERHGLAALCHQPLFELAPVGTCVHAASEHSAHIHDREPPFVLKPTAPDRLLLEQDDAALVNLGRSITVEQAQSYEGATRTMRQTLDHFADTKVDAYLYAGPIEKSGYDSICELLDKKEKGEKAILFLISGGGNPNAGYRIARALCHHYGSEGFRVAIPAECKSAGTLICIGANSLIFFDKGELGPLDVQFQKQDEIFQQSSGLDILRGMTYLRQEALDTFNEYLLEINGGSGLSTKTASEIASKLVIGLFEPMFAQIDPIRLGEMNAALQIANEYGNRLNEKSKSLKSGALSKLINNYPTHGFVIDRAEARKLFERVEPPTAYEFELSEWTMRVASGNPFRNQPKVIDLLDFFDKIFPKEQLNVGNTAKGTETVPSAEGGDASAAGADIAQGTRNEQLPVEGKPSDS